MQFNGFIVDSIHKKLQLAHEICKIRAALEYVFLLAGKFMPGMEKLASELFFPTNQQLFLTTEGSKNSWF